MNDFTILEDTRERKPWSFVFFGVEQVRKKVDTGDYTIEGYEEDITIDRKRSIDELYMNLFAEYPRFKREMERMEGMDAYVVCEFPYQHVLDFPADMPKVWCAKAKKKMPLKLRFGVDAVIQRLETLQERHGVKFLFYEDRTEAKNAAFKILKDFYESATQAE